MRTANRAFQLEAKYPGIFLLQGWLGGILGGYIILVALCLFNTLHPFFAVFWLGIVVFPVTTRCTRFLFLVSSDSKTKACVRWRWKTWFT